MKLYGGIDLHSNNSVVALLDEQDHTVYEKRLPNDLAMILSGLSPYGNAVEGLVVESTFNWYWLVDGLMDAGYRVHLANTSAMKQYEGLKHTDDHDDARWLAHMLHLEILPEGYIYPKAGRAVRDLLRKRSHLVRQRTANLLSFQNLLRRNTAESMSAAAIKRLDEAQIEELVSNRELALAMNSTLAVIRCLGEQIQIVEAQVLSQVKLEPAFQLLMTVPGIGPVLALTIMLETGDARRFDSVGQFASYCRCVSTTRLSNGKKKGEGNRKNGNKYLAWAFVEAAQHARRHCPSIRRFHDKKKAKTHAVVAIKAVAHKLSRASYHVMRDNVAFDLTKAFG